MNPKLEQELETQIGRALQGQPDLAAPPGFLTRTMAALEHPAPRHLRTWTKWPVSVRIAFFAVGLAAVAAVVVGWREEEPGLLAAAIRSLTPVAAGAKSLWNVLGALGNAVALAAEHLGKGFMLACLVAAAGACAVCAGFGTIFVRFALARPGRNSL
jgi:hypothetical protein